jgi:hypothetical protein
MVRFMKDKQRGTVWTQVGRYLDSVQITDMIIQGNFRCTRYQQQRRNTKTEWGASNVLRKCVCYINVLYCHKRTQRCKLATATCPVWWRSYWLSDVADTEPRWKLACTAMLLYISEWSTFLWCAGRLVLLHRDPVLITDRDWLTTTRYTWHNNWSII